VTSVSSLTDKAFSSLFEEFGHTAYRLETLQQYRVDYEEEPFRDFVAGRDRYTHPSHQGWVDLVASATRAGKHMSRVHVVLEPLTQYMQFELSWPYRDNVEAGEDIRILPLAEGAAWPEELTRQDYWLFDSSHAAVMRYDEEGRFEGADLVNPPEAIVEYNRMRDLAWHLSVPYEQYVADAGAALSAA
jgi:hypothetical protein